jgi:hypothetical protein
LSLQLLPKHLSMATRFVGPLAEHDRLLMEQTEIMLREELRQMIGDDDSFYQPIIRQGLLYYELSKNSLICKGRVSFCSFLTNEQR